MEGREVRRRVGLSPLIEFFKPEPDQSLPQHARHAPVHHPPHVHTLRVGVFTHEYWII